MYSRWGDKLYEPFSKLRPEIEVWLKGDDEDTDEEGDEETPAKKSIPEKRRKKLLDPTSWLRDKGLLDLARLAQQTLGEAVFDDHNEFRAQFDAALKQHGHKPSAADKKAIFKAVSWRDESAPPVIAKRVEIKPGEYFEPGYDGAYLEVVGKDKHKILSHCAV